MDNRIIAIVGSARKELMNDKENNARKAAQEIGNELAKAGWKIAVYGSNEDFIEYDVVIGYVSSGVNNPKSIACYYPKGAQVKFEAMNSNPEYFERKPDTSQDWEVSFYRSLRDMDAILLFGGASSTFI